MRNNLYHFPVLLMATNVFGQQVVNVKFGLKLGVAVAGKVQQYFITSLKFLFMALYKKSMTSRIALCLTIVLLTSCNNYYKGRTIPLNASTNKASAIDKLKLADKSFILRNGKEAYFMSNATISQDQRTLQCRLDSVTQENKLHLTNGRGGKLRYKKSEPLDINVLNEVHFYIPFDSTVRYGDYSLDLNTIQKIEVIEKDKNRTTGSYILGGIILTAGVLAIFVAVFASSISF
jgi:hypothetical protein